MTDVHDKKTRSYNMSQIKGRDTKPEILIRKFLFSKGFRFRLHDKKLPGKPDLVLPKYKVVLFVHGCFWHGHKGCRYFVLPKTRTEWWQDKIEETIKRDIKTTKELNEHGWHVIVIWECELKPERRHETLENIIFTITKEAKS
jgi:DNA mismatch endonuclease (patch repair protein)